MKKYLKSISTELSKLFKKQQKKPRISASYLLKLSLAPESLKLWTFTKNLQVGIHSSKALFFPKKSKAYNSPENRISLTKLSAQLLKSS